VQKALPLMRRGGSIVLVSSSLHLKGLPSHGTYSATKAALRSFARTWAMELKDRGIRVNTLSPGAVDTPIIDGQFATKAEADGARDNFSQMTRSAASAIRRKWRRRSCSWRRTTAAIPPAST
jgi:NAD(P)-dependent dehydrogenase (short-subunit alcohol dehydrogenase family)